LKLQFSPNPEIHADDCWGKPQYFNLLKIGCQTCPFRTLTTMTTCRCSDKYKLWAQQDSLQAVVSQNKELRGFSSINNLFNLQQSSNTSAQKAYKMLAAPTGFKSKPVNPAMPSGSSKLRKA